MRMNGGIRGTLIALDGFTALTASGRGIALATGREGAGRQVQILATKARREL